MRFAKFSPLLLVVALAACSDSDTGSNAGAGGAGTGAGANAGAGGYYGAGGRGAPGSEEELVQSVGDRVLFATDQSTLSDDARATLDRQAGWLQRYPVVSVVITGNCDERGTEEYNLALGQRRAAADASYLAAHGINTGRLQTISYGKDRPADPGSSPEAWAKNRNAITAVR